MHTTLKQLRAASACKDRYEHLRTALGPKYGDSKPITMTQIFDLNGLDDCLWAIANTQKADRLLRLFACDCAAHVLPIFEKDYPDDPRPRNCIVVSRRFANGEAAEAELAAAGDAAWAAAWAAAAAGDAAGAAAGDAAWAAARDAAGAAAAAGDAAWAAAGDAELIWQTARLREMLEAE